MTHKYIGDGAHVPGVPARDLEDEEYAAAVAAGLIVEGEPSGELYRKEGAGAVPRRAAPEPQTEEVKPDA